MYYFHFRIKAAQSIPARLQLTSTKCSFWPVSMPIHKYANRVPAAQHCKSEIHIWLHAKLKLEKRKEKMTLNLFHQLNSFIQFYFVQAGAAGLKNQISKTNQPYDAQPCWLLLFSPLHFIGIFFFSLLRSWSCSFLATRVPMDRTRCSRQHTSPLSASWNIHGQPGTAAQHSTAPHRPETTYLLISSPCCLADWGTTTAQRTRGSSHLSASQTTSSFPYCLPFNWHRSHGYIN